jgi:hypothetical protein
MDANASYKLTGRLRALASPMYRWATDPRMSAPDWPLFPMARDDSGADNAVPLTALLARAWIAFTIAADNAAEPQVPGGSVGSHFPRHADLL